MSSTATTQTHPGASNTASPSVGSLPSTASIGVAVLTHQAAPFLEDCLAPLLAAAPAPKILVVDSSSTDGTAERAKSMGADVLIIRREDFNHGATRELARRTLGTDIVVMMSQDTRPLTSDLIAGLVRPIIEGKASVSYARQLPRDGADFFEAFPRRFNYGATNEIRAIEDVRALGAYTFFCSNSCAAWSNRALDGIGGFAPTLVLEDTVAAARLLHQGHRIAYCADALVVHSHRFTLMEEFRRHFDTGYVRALHRDILLSGGRDEQRGARFARTMLSELARSKPQLLPYALASLALKYSGYRMGFHGHSWPDWLKRRLSRHPQFWAQNATQPDSPALDLRTQKIA